MIYRSVPRALLRALGAVFLCAVFLATAACGSGAGGGRQAVVPSAPAGTAPDWARGMVTVRAADLPPQARDTLALIDRGGPYPYRQDGTVFGNFEKALPRQKRGYYREFTVPTPGSRDRGARRIVTGEGGESYYTDDHYKSFKAVVR
ncbi:ribonuclease domain-containing protein [Streptomyces antimicrobicus]|uniref:Guanine-specific ribonuclease N1 and T1 n=1 Tax=Streptomyces antimicrobicus TaxID=2883108 RepID=A0ABS8B640_9ACTN|nr:ribonuclease domain-containing protein [Streptomyces antimicrobicus]MCB5180080.1 guanine-specific ribonuclease N1 and T1 [Streptomyces antimicrobicus]